MQNSPKYRVVQGGLPRRVYGVNGLAAKQRAERNAHTLAVQTLHDIPATVPEGARHWAYDVRRGRMTVYGGVLRFLDLLHRRGVPMETALMVPAWIEEFIREEWNDRPPVARAERTHAA